MRRRILLLVVGMTTLVIVAFAIPMLLLIRSTVAQQAQQSTQEQARFVVGALKSLRTDAAISTLLRTQTRNSGRPTWVILLHSRTVLGTAPAGVGSDVLGGGSGSAAGGSESPFPRPSGAGISRADDGRGGAPDGGLTPQANLHPASGGQVASAFDTLADGRAYVVQVYLADDAQYAGESGKFALLGGAALALIVLAAAAGEVFARRLARPLVQQARTARQLSGGDTTARATTGGPVEVAELGRSLNRLADRIDELIAEERETVADLSHRLRTPLTALRLDAESLRDPVDAERMGNHVSALERTLTAVIHAARRPQREGRIPSCDAREVVTDRVSFWSALTEEQQRRATVAIPTQALPVRAGAEDLAAAVDALLENIVAHTPEGTDFSIRLQQTAAGARLTVSDDGPGLPERTPERGRSDRGSSGLGLDIARRCAQASGGSMTLGAAASGGARIVLDLGSP